MAVGTSHCGDEGCHSQVQAFTVSSDAATVYRIGVRVPSGDRRHALVELATDATTGQSAAVNALRVREALVMHISDHIFDVVEVSGSGSQGSQQSFSLTFSGNPGNHELIEIDTVSGPGQVIPGTVAITTTGTTEELECSGRGLCNRGLGECECFEGYGREDCGVQVTSKTYLDRQQLAIQAANLRKGLDFHQRHHHTIIYVSEADEELEALELELSQLGLA